MDYKRFGEKIVARLEVGDEIMESLRKISERENIRAAQVTGLGAVDRVDLAFYKLAVKEYSHQVFEEEFELLSMVGNLTINEGKFHPHIHVVLGKDDFTTLGGHLNSANVSVTVEIIINVIDGEITRLYNDQVGLNTIDIS